MTRPTLQAWLCEVKYCVEIAIYVLPGAGATEVAGEHDGALKLRIHAPPLDGKANSAVVGFLALKLGVAKTKIELISGDKSRRKRLLILGVTAELVHRTVLSALSRKVRCMRVRRNKNHKSTKYKIAT